MSDPVVLLSTGDVVGPAGGVTNNSMVLFSGTSGKLIKGNNAVVTAAGLAILDDVNAAAQRVTLGLGTAATSNVTTSPIDTTAGSILTVGADITSQTTGTISVARGGTGATTAATARTNLGLGNVDNTSDASKPVSTATQTALNLKAPIASPEFTGSVSAPIIELGSPVGASNAFIDFHSGAVVTDYDSRILATTGTGNGTAGYGTLHIVAGLVDMTTGAAGAQTVRVNTAPADTNSVVAASTAFVVGQASSTTPVMDSTAAVGTSLKYARADHVHPSDTTKAPLASPALTGNPTAPTAPQFDNDTSIATTAFVQRALGNIRESCGQIAANTTLTAADAGKAFVVTSNAALIGLPPLSATGPGTAFTFLTDRVVTFQGSGGELIHNGKTVSGTYTIFPGESLTLLAGVGGTTWYVTSQGFGSAAFATSPAANGYQKLPSGLIIQWGRVANASRAVDGTALGPISYPISFPNAVFAVNAQMIGGEAVALSSLDGFLFVKTVGTSSFNLISGFSAATTFEFGAYWLAIGY